MQRIGQWIAAAILAAGIGYMGWKEVSVPPVHTVHLVLLCVMVLVDLALAFSKDFIDDMLGLRDALLPFWTKQPPSPPGAP